MRGTGRAEIIVGALSGEGYDAKPRGFKDYDKMCVRLFYVFLFGRPYKTDGQSEVRAMTSAATAPMTPKVTDSL